MQWSESQNTQHSEVNNSTWPVSLGPYDSKASELQQTGAAWKMDWSGKIFGSFQSNSLFIHRYHRWQAEKFPSEQGKKKKSHTHLLLIALSHPCREQTHTHTHTTQTTHTHYSCSSQCPLAPKGIVETAHPPSTHAVSGGSRLWGRLSLTRCHTKFTCLMSDWVLWLASALQWLVSWLESSPWLRITSVES